MSQSRNPGATYGGRKRKWILFFGLLTVLVASYPAFEQWYAHNQVSFEDEITFVAQPVFAGVTMEAKFDGYKESILDKLQACESAGHSDADGIIIFDANNEPSIGQFQFQRKTVQHYYKTLYAQDITRKEAVIIALDTEKARDLARDIIFKVKGGVFNWQNCANSTGIIPKIEVIKELEK